MLSKNISRICLTVIICLSLVLSATACNANKSSNSNQYKTQNAKTKQNEKSKPKANSKQNEKSKPSAKSKQNANMKQKAKNTEHLYSTPPVSRSALPKQLSDRVSHMDGVDKATVLVSNQDILVGVDAKKGKDPKVVEENVRHHLTLDQPGYRVHVTSDKKLHARIRNLNTKVNGGHPIQHFSNDVKAILRDIGKTVTAPFKR
ncbi:YhcN/YlaJ family sporulation lipoprotein [Paenibacillus sp. DYY-L-2]|uniref:YhcN/YlaJ family sporulation lipoprotein n=1 Tax=Paenibacillus sp. DYY-L-2 TaxID=3447013 RepID=UPI003F4FE418